MVHVAVVVGLSTCVCPGQEAAQAIEGLEEKAREGEEQPQAEDRGCAQEVEGQDR